MINEIKDAVTSCTLANTLYCTLFSNHSPYSCRHNLLVNLPVIWRHIRLHAPKVEKPKDSIALLAHFFEIYLNSTSKHVWQHIWPYCYSQLHATRFRNLIQYVYLVIKMYPTIQQNAWTLDLSQNMNTAESKSSQTELFTVSRGP
jgi:hypothetical protein